MNADFSKGFLTDEDMAQVRDIMGMHGIEGFDASVRFWGRGKAVQVSGDLGEKQLQCLLEIVRALSAPSTATPVAEAIIESPAPTPPATKFARAA